VNAHGRNAALPGQPLAAASTPQPAQMQPLAAPLRVGAASQSAIPIARPAPLPVPQPDFHTRPVLPPPPIRHPMPPPAPVPTRPWSVRVRRYAGHLNPLQFVCWQIAAIAVLLSVRQPWPVIVATSAGAAALVAMTTVRAGGRWLYELGPLTTGYLTRSRRRDLPEGGAKTVSLLGMLLPGAGIRTVDTSAGQVMAISHHGGLTALIKPDTLTPALPSPAALLPPPDGQQRFGVQQIFHVGVRQRRLLLAVHATRTVQMPADDELTLALRNGLRRVRRALARAGVPAEPLAEDAALATIAGLTHITGGRGEVREDWRFWRTGAVNQAVFRLTGWDRLPDAHARRLIDLLLAGFPGVAATVTCNARTGAAADAVLRLASTTEAAVEAAAANLAGRLAPFGVDLARLDGTQLSGVAASLPIGVFLP
jgi:hypothetical protein